MTPVVREMSSVTIADTLIKRADQLSLAGKSEEAVSKYRVAMQICPAFSARASYSISQILAGRKKQATEDANQTK
jgi:hypothetical protein